MKLTSSLDSLLASSLSIEKKQQALIELTINAYQPQERIALFQTVTDYRRRLLESFFPEHQHKSLSVLFELMDYRELIQRYPSSLSKEMALLEAAASQCYMHWLDFWCECEIAAIKAKSPLDASAPSHTELPIKDSAYYGAIIERIEDDPLVVQTPSHPQGMSISDAIALSNLEVFIKGEKWFELFDSGMIANIAETDSSEASSYLSTYSVIWTLLMGGVPAMIVYKVKLQSQRHQLLYFSLTKLVSMLSSLAGLPLILISPLLAVLLSLDFNTWLSVVYILTPLMSLHDIGTILLIRLTIISRIKVCVFITFHTNRVLRVAANNGIQLPFLQ